MDIGIRSDTGIFKLRSCAIFVKDNKVLVERSRKYDGYSIIGGHIALGENSKTAVVREVKEELKVNSEIKNLICVNENIYVSQKDKKIGHEVCFYYLMETQDELPCDGFEFEELDNGKKVFHRYNWINLNSFDQNNVCPNWLADKIIANVQDEYVLTDERGKCNE